MVYIRAIILGLLLSSCDSDTIVDNGSDSEKVGTGIELILNSQHGDPIVFQSSRGPGSDGYAIIVKLTTESFNFNSTDKSYAVEWLRYLTVWQSTNAGVKNHLATVIGEVYSKGDNENPVVEIGPEEFYRYLVTADSIWYQPIFGTVFYTNGFIPVGGEISEIPKFSLNGTLLKIN